MKKRMILMLLAVGVVFGVVFAAHYFGLFMMNKIVDSMPIPPVTVTAGEVKQMTWDNRLEGIGSIVPVNGTDVTTEAGGIVTAIHFESGQKVEKGARLVTLDGANERAEYKRLQAQAELSELNRARREKLYMLEAISKSDYDAAATEAVAARAAVEAQGAKLAQKEIRAPFSGELGIRRVNVGQYLQTGSPIVSLQSLDPIDIDFAMPEQYIGAVRAGFKVAVKIEAFPDLEFGGEVLAVEPRVDEATRNFQLRARLPNPDHQLRAGQFGRVRLELPGSRQLLVVPRTAINYDSYGTSVFVVQKKIDPDAPKPEPMPGMPPAEETDLEVVQRFIKVGEARGDFIAVVDGIKAGEQVATSGLLKLRNQQPVIINNSSLPKTEMNPKPPMG